MSYLLDTNVVSERMKSTPDKRVMGWLESVPPETLHVSVVSLGEIHAGIEKEGLGEAKKEALRKSLEVNVLSWLKGNILPVDEDVAKRWGYLRAARWRSILPLIDSFLAATTLTHNLQMVTRNTRDFDIPGLGVIINPWG